MEKIRIEEVHSILTSIMKEVHNICVEEGIPYYLAGGSMLGAIRHNGFIPWDDDMDICVPRKYFNQFIETMKKRLHEPYTISTYKDSEWMIAGFVKIQDTTTIIDDESMKCKLEDRPGVNIDIFPIDECSQDINWNLMKFWKICISLRNSDFKPTNKYRAFARKIAKIFVPILREKDYYIEKIDNYAARQKGEYICTVWGRYGKEKELIPAKIWGTPKLYKYEDTQFYGVERADEYLTHLYGNYMELPPVEKRFVHVENIYRK